MFEMQRYHFFLKLLIWLFGNVETWHAASLQREKNKTPHNKMPLGVII